MSLDQAGVTWSCATFSSAAGELSICGVQLPQAAGHASTASTLASLVSLPQNGWLRPPAMYVAQMKAGPTLACQFGLSTQRSPAEPSCTAERCGVNHMGLCAHGKVYVCYMDIRRQNCNQQALEPPLQSG